MDLLLLLEKIRIAIDQYMLFPGFYKNEASLQYLLAHALNDKFKLITTEFKINEIGVVDIVIGEENYIDINNGPRTGIELKFFYHLEGGNHRHMGINQAMHCFLDIVKAKRIVQENIANFHKIFVVWVFQNGPATNAAFQNELVQNSFNTPILDLDSLIVLYANAIENGNHANATDIYLNMIQFFTGTVTIESSQHNHVEIRIIEIFPNE